MSNVPSSLKDTRWYIGGVLNKVGDGLEASDFVGQSWTEIDGLTEVGELGDTVEVGTQLLIKGGRAVKYLTTSDAGSFDNMLVPMPLDPGQKLFQAAINDKCNNYAFKVEYGSSCAPSSAVTFTISVGTATVVNWTAHGLVAGQPVVFSGGTPPTGITAGNVYYVLASGLTADGFQISATDGGSAIVATGAASGTVTADAPPIGKTFMFTGFAKDGKIQGGDATAAFMRSWSAEVNSNIVVI